MAETQEAVTEQETPMETGSELKSGSSEVTPKTSRYELPWLDINKLWPNL